MLCSDVRDATAREDNTRPAMRAAVARLVATLAAVMAVGCGEPSAAPEGGGGEGEAVAEGEAGSDSEADSEADSVAGSDSEADSEADSVAESEAVAESETESGGGVAEVLEARVAHPPHGTLAGAPHVVVSVPGDVDRDAPPSLVVFLHGWSGCARALAASEAVPCRDGGRARRGWALAERHRAAGTGSILVIPQLAWMARTGEPGRFAEDGAFARFLGDVLSGPVAESLGSTPALDDVPSITLVAHSAGYETALAVLRHGGVGDAIDRVALLDALYAGAATFGDWTTAGDDHRIVSLYTGEASTHRQSHALARRLRDALGDDAVSVDAGGDLTDLLRRHRAVVDRSPYPHGAIPTRQLTPILRGLR